MRRMLIGMAVSLVAGAALPAAASASKYCGSVTFEPNTDYTDGNIRATNLACPWAIAVAVRWTVEGTRTTPYSFRCTYRGVNKGLAHADVRCVRRASIVTFMSY